MKALFIVVFAVCYLIIGAWFVSELASRVWPMTFNTKSGDEADIIFFGVMTVMWPVLCIIGICCQIVRVIDRRRGK